LKDGLLANAYQPFTAEEVKNPPRLPTNKVIPIEINNFISKECFLINEWNR
jgi:hypothetical protein